MTTADKAKFAQRMAEARAKKTSSTKKTGAKKKAGTTKKKTTAAGKSTAKKKAVTPKKRTVRKAVAAVKKTVKKAATTIKRKVRSVVPKPLKKSRTVGALSKAKGLTIPVPDLSKLKGMDYMDAREEFAQKIHKASDTGRKIMQPVYGTSIKDARRQADKALALTKRGKIGNAKLKVKTK